MPRAAASLDAPKPKRRRKTTAAEPATSKTKESLNLRIDRHTRDLIDRAAGLSGQTRTDFMLMSARERATDVLLNQTLFVLEKPDSDAFMLALDNPPAPNAALTELLAHKAPWER